MSGRKPSHLTRQHANPSYRAPSAHLLVTGVLSLALAAGVLILPISVLDAPAGATTLTAYTPGTPVVDTITNGTSAAPWNTSQGDSATAAYSSADLLPTYTSGGSATGSGSSAEPNVAVYPSAGSGTAGVSPYPSGVVGTPGPLDGYCGSGNQTTESAGSPVRQPAGSVLPFAPAYFPHVVRNADGSLTGYFDYRPKDADEALIAAKSTDNAKSWTYEGEALEENPGYCPSADINDDGQGHANVITVGGVSRLYTLQRPAGDNAGVGELIHTLTPTPTNPLAGLPATEKVGIDPDAFVPTGDGVTVPFTGGTAVSISLNQVGLAGSPEQLLAGGFVDLTQTPTPTASSVINCTGVGTSSITGCTTTQAAGITVAAGDLIEQVIGYVSGAVSVPAGPNSSVGTGGLGTINVTTTAGGAVKGFTNSVTGTTYNVNAPNRAYIDGVAVYCNQANANPTTKMEDCTTGPGGSTLAVANGDPITADPIVPATASQTNGLVAPDGIVGTLPSYPNDGTVPVGATYVMYTEKELAYFVAGTTTNASSAVFGSSIVFTPSPYEAADMPATISAVSPVTVEMGDSTKTTIIPVTCTGLTTGATDTLTGCTVPAANVGDSYSSTSLIGAPGAATVPGSSLALTGEGSTTSTAKLFKNNEDLTILRVAWTTDGVNFSTTGLTNGGIISGASNGATNYQDISNPSSTVSPSNLNAYATPGTADATEMRWVGSSGSIIVNPDGSYGLFLSGAWAGDGDSDAFNQIFYSHSTDGENWSIPTTVVSTDYTFSASVVQDAALADNENVPLGISAYYSGRAYGPSVVQNPNGSLTMVFSGYRSPKPIPTAGTVLGTNPAAQWTVGATDPALYRNILTMTLTSATSPGVGTTTVLSSAPSSPVVGQAVTLTGTVSVPSPGTGIPTGTVTFTDAGGTLCSGTLSDAVPDTASCMTTYTGATTDTVTATYGGDANYATSNGAGSVTIATAATTTAVTSSLNPSVTGQPTTYTATLAVTSPGVGTPTGTVSFTDNGTAVATSAACPGTLSATSPPKATCAVPEPTSGAHAIVATYGGSANFSGSVAPTLTQTVTPAATTTVMTFSPLSPVVGQLVTFTATVGAAAPGAGTPTGTVIFSDPGGTLCSGLLNDAAPDVASCTATYQAVTTDAVTATYGGDANFAGSGGGTTVTVMRNDAALWAAASNGGVFTIGGSRFYGSAGGIAISSPVVGMAATPDGGGYWLVESDGTVLCFGDAKFFGSTSGLTLNKPIVAMAATPDGQGYWLVSSDGGVFAFGDAGFFGSTGGLTLNKPIVGMAPTPDGGGYWLVASDGGIFSFGDAQFFGSTGGTPLIHPVVGMAATRDGLGYWLVTSNGGIFTFGDATYDGSTWGSSLTEPVVGMAATPDGGGYWLLLSTGEIFTFGDAQFEGTLNGLSPAHPFVGLAAG